MTVRSDAPRSGAPAWGALVGGALVVGSVVAVDPAGWAPFGPAKWLVVSTLGFAAAGSLLWSGAVSPNRRSLVAWGVLLGWLALAALAGDDVPTAWLGQPDRHLGWVTWLLFALLFVAGQQLADSDARRTVVRSSVLAALGLGLWSVWEVIAGPPISIVTESSRLTGPFGSAAYLGAASCLLVPIAVGAAADRDERPAWRALAVAGAVVGGVGLIGSGARAAWVAMLVGVAVALVRVRSPRRLLLSGIAALGVLVLVGSPWLGSLVERSAGATSRLDEWAVAGRVIGDHPVVGVGPEGYRIAVEQGIDRHYERTYGRDVVLPDRAHSGPLEVALAGGLPAAMLFVGLIAFVVWRAWSAVRAAPPSLVGVAVGLIAYAVQQALLFPLAEIDPVWWLLAGMVVTSTRAPLPAATASAPATGGRRWWRVPALAAFGLAAVAFVGGVLDVAADRLAKQALDASGDGRADLAVERAERATELRPDGVRYRLLTAELLARRGTLADVDEAMVQTQRALDWSPLDPLVVDRAASLLLERAAITGEPVDVGAAVDSWRQLVERDPLRTRWQLQYGRAAALAGDDETARRAWTIAADLAPSDPAIAQLLAELEALG